MKAARLLAVLLMLVLAAPAAAEASRERVVGNYINDLTACLEGAVAPAPPAPPATLSFSCTGGSVYFGALTGHTHILFDGTYDAASGEVYLTFDEWLFARHLGDGTEGALHYRGEVHANVLTQEFTGEARVVDGACGFDGSRGKWSFDGTFVAGSYVLEWVRPGRPRETDRTCLATTTASVLADRMTP